MPHHTIEPDARTLHGPFSRERQPVLIIEPGDSVRYRTLDARWHTERWTDPDRAGVQFPGREEGHALSGPIFVNGAEPGMTLEVRVRRLVPADWGWNAGGGLKEPMLERLGVAEGKRQYLLWSLDRDAMTGTDQFGHTVALRPFMGVMGNAPPDRGMHPTGPPRRVGGNIDCRELVEGSRLWLPVAVPGALFSVGDGHAAQGDGEVSGTAIECGMDVCELEFGLRPEMKLEWPAAETPAGSITFGFDEDLDEAVAIALASMLDLVQDRLDVDRKVALGLASVAVQLRVTQIVNGTRGVHALLPPGSIA